VVDFFQALEFGLDCEAVPGDREGTACKYRKMRFFQLPFIGQCEEKDCTPSISKAEIPESPWLAVVAGLFDSKSCGFLPRPIEATQKEYVRSDESDSNSKCVISSKDL